MSALILYLDAFWANPWDCAPYVALREKGADFSTAIALVRDGQGVTPGIRHHAITGLEPALQHGDFWVAESMAIVEYVEDLYPAPTWPRIFPADLRQRARARQVMSWVRTELLDLRRERTSTVLFYPRPSLPPLGTAASRQAAELIAVAERLAPSEDGALFGAWCIADVDLSFVLMRLVRTGYPVPAPLVAYAEAVWRRPSVREYVSHSRPPHSPS